MKKFLLILHCLLSGGAINSVVTLAEVLQKMGYNLTVVSKNDGFVREKFESMGIEVIIQEDLVGEQFLQHVKKDYDHILVNTLLLFSVVEKLKNSKVKVHWWIHEPPLYFQSLGEQVCKSFWNDLSDNVTVYAAGRLILDWVRREYDYKCCLLNFGIEDCARVLQKQEVFEFSSDKITFLIPSVFIQYIKGQDLMVKAIRGLSEEYINRAEFLFLGNNMDDEDFYHLVSSEIEQESSIKLIPAVEKQSLFRLMTAADCIVAPSRQDATNACIVEGLMLSKICLCSDGTGVSHYMEDCVNGFIFSSGNVEELQARIMLIIDNFERLNVIAQNGRKIYEKIFSMKVFEENVSQYWKNGGEKW